MRCTLYGRHRWLRLWMTPCIVLTLRAYFRRGGRSRPTHALIVSFATFSPTEAPQRVSTHSSAFYTSILPLQRAPLLSADATLPTSASLCGQTPGCEVQQRPSASSLSLSCHGS